MGIRSILRVGMVVLAASVGILVWTRWQPEPAATTEATPRPVPEIPRGERDVRSSTSALDVSQTADGQETLHIAADRQTDFEDGWSVWEGRPRITIFGRDPATDSDDVHVTGDTMRTEGDVGSFTEVRLIGNVEATLPGGGSFTTRRIDYDMLTGVASNCSRNLLGYAGLDIGSDCLEFNITGDTTAGDELVAEMLRMWGDLDLAASPDGGGSLPDGLTGGGRELRFRPGADRVTIDGEAVLAFSDTTVEGQVLELAVGADVRDLEGVRAVGGGRLTLVTEDGERVLVGDELSIGLLDNSVESVSATGAPSRLRLPGLGTLRARSIELSTGGDELVVAATGAVEWSGEGGSGSGPQRLTSGSLQLRSVGGQLSALEADGRVALEGGERLPGVFRGPSLKMAWDGDAVSVASWPEGVELEDADRSLRAGIGRRIPTGWVLEGEPRPSVEGDGLSLVANRLQLADAGGLLATGAVSGRLGGELLTAGAALFGDAAEVEIRSEAVVLGEDGQTILRNNVQVVWGSQSLVTDELVLERSPGRLRASGNVELVAALESESEGEEGADEVAVPVTVTARDLLVEEGSGEIHVARDARLRQSERTIGADRMAILLSDEGGWRTIEAAGEVEFREPGITAEGARLEYDLETGELLLLGGEDRPARFVYEDLEYRSAEALRVLREGDDLVIEATEAGRTTTKVVPTDGTDGERSGQK